MLRFKEDIDWHVLQKGTQQEQGPRLYVISSMLVNTVNLIYHKMWSMQQMTKI